MTTFSQALSQHDCFTRFPCRLDEMIRDFKELYYKALEGKGSADAS
jgi:hypothetical protein